MTPAAPFYHGTTADLAVGAVIVPPAVRCPESPASAQAHPVTEGTVRSDPGACYMTEYRRDAMHWGARVYVVEPVGRIFADPNGSDGDWEVAGYLKVVAHA